MPCRERVIFNEYVEALHWKPYEPFRRGVRGLLKEPYGITVYQEDPLRMVIALADFSHEEADYRCKVLTKKRDCGKFPMLQYVTKRSPFTASKHLELYLRVRNSSGNIHT